MGKRVHRHADDETDREQRQKSCWTREQQFKNVQPSSSVLSLPAGLNRWAEREVASTRLCRVCLLFFRSFRQTHDVGCEHMDLILPKEILVGRHHPIASLADAFPDGPG